MWCSAHLEAESDLPSPTLPYWTPVAPSLEHSPATPGRATSGDGAGVKGFLSQEQSCRLPSLGRQ